MKKPLRMLGAAVLLCALLLASCGKKGPAAPTELPTPQATESGSPIAAVKPQETVQASSEAAAPPEVTALPAAPTPSPMPVELVSALDGIRAQIREGLYYKAFQSMLRFEEENHDPEELEACEALVRELNVLLRGIEPASGTELVRTFAVQGGCVLEVSAFTGPVLVTAVDEYAVLEGNPNPNTVTFYVRQGETGQANLPAGTYRISYKVGYRWFGEEEGFGEYFTAGALEEPLVFDFYMDGGWASNSKYSITF
jgi:hypothetical protein